MIPTILLPPVNDCFLCFYMFYRLHQHADVRLFLSDKKITLSQLIVKWLFCMSDITKANIESTLFDPVCDPKNYALFRSYKRAGRSF